MTLIEPFRALRPAPGRAADVLAPPYDVLSSAEARERAKLENAGPADEADAAGDAEKT